MEKIKKLKEYWWVLTTLILILTEIWAFFGVLQGFKDENEELVYTLKTTQQMSLKSVIWNEAIPIAERASACDVYLNAGYNSLTKKECEIMLK